MNAQNIRVALLLLSVFVAYLAYATFYSHAIIKDKQSGKIIFGYDHEAGKFYFNEYPLALNRSDGPYVFYNDMDSLAMIMRTVEKNENDLQIEKEAISLSDLYEDGLKVPADSAGAFQVYIQKEITIPASTYASPDRLLAFSDIEGNFYALKQLLLYHGVMDEKYNWTFGNGHVVLAGDLMDRGEEVIPCLWLIYRLEQLAKIHQGRIHFLLGNHEQMNLKGDERYLASKYKSLSDIVKKPYLDFFNEQTELGRWLRTKNAIEKIGNTLFVHGGISNEVADLLLPLDSINSIIRKNLTAGKDDLSAPASVLLHMQTGLLWYRGWVEEKTYPRLTQQEAEIILQKMNASRLVVAHTVVPAISTDYNNKLIRLDVMQPAGKAEGSTQALLIEKEKWYAVTDNNTKTLLFTEQ